MAKARSPQYPAFGLQEAIELIRKVHGKVHTHKAPPLVMAQAMGYTSMNGKSVTKLSTLKKYDLIEEVGNELRVTKTALTILFEPANTATWKTAMKHAALAPALFARLSQQYPGSIPSDELVRSYLLQNGFLVSTVELPVRAFRDTMELVSPFYGEYNGDKPEEQEEEQDSIDSDPTENDRKSMNESVLERMPSADSKPLARVQSHGAPSQATVALGGRLGLGATYHLVIEGEVGSKEITKLIKLLEAQKALLEDADEGRADVA
jgi:hypothetical protein